MKFDDLLHFVGQLPFFDLPLLTQLSGESKRSLVVQLHQWSQKKKVIPLRRGLYALGESYRKSPPPILYLANEIYKPSYLSDVWALSFHGMIPERVITFTSATPRVTRAFENDFGIFSYSTLKKDFFWGFGPHTIDGMTTWIAEPEKALLDHWHWHSGEWTVGRLIEMRFQQLEQVDKEKLVAYAKKWGSPRLIKTTTRFIDMMDEEMKGYREL